MKKKLGVVLLVFAALLSFPILAHAYETGTYDNLSYCINDNDTVEITACDKSAENVIIPDIIKGKPVTSISGSFGSGGAFSYCVELKTIILPETLNYIGDSAFEGCISLKEISIPDKVISMGTGVFLGCTALDKVKLPNNIEYIDWWMFEGCENLKSFIIPDGIISIGEHAFSGCVNLEAVDIPDSVTKIGRFAFSDCEKLKSVHISSNVQEIGDYAFLQCLSLSEIVVDENNTIYCDIDGVLFNFDKTTLIQYPAGKECDEYIVPSSVTNLERYSIRYAGKLYSVVLPESVRYVFYCFEDCKNLKKVSIPSNVTEISDCFDNSLLLEAINVSADNQYYTDVDGVLYNKDKTELIFYPGGKRDKSFYADRNLTNIHDNAFSDCADMTNIRVSEENAVYCDVDGILFSKDKSELIIYPAAKKNEIYYIPETTTSVAGYAFSRCKYLQSLVIPKSVSKIAAFSSNPFQYADSIKNIYYPGSEDQWKDISIGVNFTFGNISNSKLINGTIHFNSIYSTSMAEDNSVNNSIIVITNINSLQTSDKEKSEVFVALYDESGAVIDSYNAVYNGSEISGVLKNDANADHIKVFVWNKDGSLEPITDVPEYISL